MADEPKLPSSLTALLAKAEEISPTIVETSPSISPTGSVSIVSAGEEEEEKQLEVDPITARIRALQPRERSELQPGEELAELFEQLQGVTPFQNQDFNIDAIVNLFDSGTTDPSQGFLDKDNTAEFFEQSLKKVIEKALKSADAPTQIRGIFRTLGEAANQIDTNTNQSPVEFIESVIEDEFPIFRVKQLEGKITQPVNIPALISTLFSTDLDDLQRRTLGPAEIGAIRTEFQQDLSELESQIIASNDIELQAREIGAEVGRPDLPFVLFGQNTFRMLQDYINEHVQNNQLRTLLLGDIQQSIAANRQKLGIQLGEAPPQITPISATQVSVLREPIAQAIGNVIGESLNTINEAQARIDRSRREPTRLKEAQRARVLETVKIFNSFVERNTIRSPSTGMLITIATENVTAPVSAVDAPASARRIEKVEPVDTAELIAKLNSLAGTLARNIQTFEHVPTRITDPGTGQTREGVIQDIIDMERMMKIMSQQKIKGRRELISSISRRATFPNIDVLRARRRRQQMDGQTTETFGARMREIRIKKDVTLAELAKIANMIAMENGSLETINESPLLDIRKGVTTIQEIIEAIMSQQKTHAGNDFSLIFVPANVFGGMFLDGALDVIHKSRMLVSPVGGDIFSSIFNTIGNVAKTVASVPLQIAGSVFGGGLQPMAKPLFRPDIFRRPIGRRADAPQTGGILLPDTLVQGEHQPEPFINRSQDQQFHIQPFPFGGRIDNTGFIDQSQANPKFEFANMHLIPLTAFA